MAPLFCLTGAKVNIIYYTPNVSMENIQRKCISRKIQKKVYFLRKKTAKLFAV